jgi:hypothetical protein
VYLSDSLAVGDLSPASSPLAKGVPILRPVARSYKDTIFIRIPVCSGLVLRRGVRLEIGTGLLRSEELEKKGADEISSAPEACPDTPRKSQPTCNIRRSYLVSSSCMDFSKSL